jgi:hypothetical protein
MLALQNALLTDGAGPTSMFNQASNSTWLFYFCLFEHEFFITFQEAEEHQLLVP